MLAGTFAFGMGDTLNKAAMQDVPAGGYALMPAQMHHYAMAKTATTLQIHANGPLVFNYVNPADDPSRRAQLTRRAVRRASDGRRTARRRRP